ncbi:MAG: phosphoribosyltransferase [Phycisphaerales bacterium]
MLTIRGVLLERQAIAQRVEALGRQIAADLQAEGDRLQARGQAPGPIVMVPVLTGALVFTADLIRAMGVKMSIRPVTLSSYPGKSTTSQGVTVQGGVPTDLAGALVVIVDDILDSGRTLGLLRRLISAQNPQSVRLAVLLDKQKAAGRDEDVSVEYAGFVIADEFVVGYGLDFDGYYRNLPDICTMHDDGKPEA